MARAQRGDRDAFDEVVRIHHRLVYGYARRVLGDEDAAVDVTQDVFVRAWRYRASCDPPRVRGWLLGIATNRVRDALRERGERPDALEDPASLPASGEAGLALLARGALRDEVARAVEALPPEQREVIALKYLSDLSYEEVAEALSLSVGAARMRALRARDALARALSKLVQSGESAQADDDEVAS